MVRTGAFTYIQWGEESTFGTPATQATVDKAFGYEQKISSWTMTNNKIPLPNLNNLHVDAYAYGTTRGSIGLDYVLSSPFWLRNLFGAPTTGGAGPFNYDYPTPTTLSKIINSFTIEIGTVNVANIVRTLAGCIMNSVSIKSTIGDVVRASADISYASEAVTTTLETTPPTLAVATEIPYTFAHGTLGYDTGAGVVTIAEVQDVDFTINQNSDLLYGQGSHTAVGAYRKLHELTGSFRASWINTNLLIDIFEQVKHNGAPFVREQLTLTLTFSNGEAAGALRNQIYTFSGIAIADLSLPIEPNEPIFETINWQARTVTITTKSGVAAE